MIVDALIQGWNARFGRTQSDGWTGSGFTSLINAGSVKTKAGEAINERNGEKFSAVWRATRVITDCLACLPLNLREHLDDKNTATAYDHPLQTLMHDAPNPLMNSYSFFDMQVPLQMNWGDAFAEIQRDIYGKVVALHPIHPSRLPIRNRVNGPVTYGSETYGEEGEIVYLVRNTDGTCTPILGRNMLHVPGVMSGDGINGKSLVRVAAETLGIISAMETHVGAFYKNGATPDIVVTIKSPIKPEEKMNLRESWKSMHSGASNAHNMLLLTGEASAEPLGIDPDKAQLLESRRFSVEEVSRFWGVPKHFLSSLDGANYNSLELLNDSFVLYSFLPWCIRWEKSLNQQLLTVEERPRYFFKFALNSMMRGDSAARSQFYSRLFDMGVLSIDEIRELEDMNPLPNGMGQRYFILANNRVPLDRIDDIALLQGSAKPVAATPSENASSTVSANIDLIEEVSEGSVEEITIDETVTTTAGVLAAARGIVESTISGLIYYESEKVRRASGKYREFETKIEAFYAAEQFPEMLSSRLGPLLSSLEPLGIEADATAFAETHCGASKAELLQLLDVPLSQFEESVSRTVANWSSRATVETDALFSQKRSST